MSSLEHRRLQSSDITGVQPEHILLHVGIVPLIGYTAAAGHYFAESASEAARRQLNQEAAAREVARRQEAAEREAARQQGDQQSGQQQ